MNIFIGKHEHSTLAVTSDLWQLRKTLTCLFNTTYYTA